MSANTPRGRGGTSSSRGFRGAAQALSTRGSTRGRGATGTRGGSGSFRGSRGGGATSSTPASNNAPGLLQQMRSGTVGRGANSGANLGARGRGPSRAASATTGRGRGSGFLSKTFNKPSHDDSPSNLQPPSPFAAGDSTDPGDVQQRYNVLKNLREEERREAIQKGFLADPEKKTTLDKAITPVGTCTEMCPPFERVERIVQMMVDRCEKVSDPSGGKPVASEEIMVKRFRRSAAGDDEQVPSDIRTPETLRKTLDYLVDKLIGGPERLAVVHKFVWDRTRAIRNDFSIKQVSKEEDVRIAVDCFERIARFHIVALHHLSNPENLHEGENFDVFQEREQLNNTLLSLMYYYDDHRDQIAFPNEAEFRAYHIVLAFQSQHPDIEDRVQSWPLILLADSKVQTALRLYQAAGNTLFDQGPLRPMTPFPVAQNDSGRFWTLMNSGAVSYTLACITELYFNQVRFGALSSLWRSCKSAPAAQQAKLRDWTADVVTEYLGFDEDEQTADFCGEFGLSFQTDDQGVTYLDLAANNEKHLDQSLIPKEIVFSQTFVEDKRCRRTLMAVINNVRPADAIRHGLVEEGEGNNHQEAEDDGEGLFIPESKSAPRTFGQGAFNPEASSFKPSGTFGSNPLPSNTIFGQQTSGSPPPAQARFGVQAEEAAVQKPGFNFGQQTKKPRDTTPPLSTNFGDSVAANNASTTAANGLQLGHVAASTTTGVDQPPAQPRWMTNFGQNRPSIEENNPFGLKANVPSGNPGLTPSQAPATGNLTQPQKQNGFSFQSLGQKQDESSPVSPFTAPKPAESELPPAQPPSSGFHFAKPNLPAASTTSSTAQTAAPFFSTTSPSGTQSSLPAFSFKSPAVDALAPATSSAATSTTQLPSFAFPKHVDLQFPKADSDNSSNPLSSHSTNATAQKPFFNFTPPTSTAAASTAPELKKAAGIQATFNTAVDPLKAPQNQGQPSLKPPSTTSQPAETPKPPTQPSLFSFKPATVSDPTPTDATPTQPTFSFPSATPQSSDPQATAPQAGSTTPPHSPLRPTPAAAPVDKNEIIDHTARLLLTQPHGLLIGFLEWSLPQVIRGVQRRHAKELRQQKLDLLKESYLYRKYGAIWRSIAWRNNLNKRASKRRQLLSTSVKMDALNKQRQEEELKQILSAVEESKRLQAEASLRRSQEAEVKSNKKAEPSQLAGSKRKSLGENPNGASPSVSHDRPKYQHKRSRTIGSMLPPAPPTKAATPTSSPGQFRHSIFSGGASLGRSTVSNNPRLSEIRPKQDRTRSAYFDLLARGIDPDTPAIPLTARQVEAKRRREKEEREASIARAHNRRLVGTASTQRSPPVAPSIASAVTPPSPPVSAPSPQPSLTGSTYNADTDELLQQLRAARQELADQSKWFQDQQVLMQQEAEQQEKLRSSAGSDGSPVTHRNGRSHRNFSPASSMSRVDQILLKRPGAQKLADYKPMKGSDYLPVPMSKRSAQVYAQQSDDKEIEIETNGTAKKRRKRGVIDPSYRPGKDELEDDEDGLNFSPQKRTKKHAIPARVAKMQAQVVPNAQYLQSTKQNPFASPQDLQGPDEVDLTGDEGDFEEEEAEEDLGGYGAYFKDNDRGLPVTNGPEDDSEEELIEDPDAQGYVDSEDLIDDLEDEEDNGIDYDSVDQARLRRLQQGIDRDDQEADLEEYDEDDDEDEEGDVDAHTPYTQATDSRATSSGPGATVDDAIALSDSD